MTSERWQKIEQLYHAALECEEDRRAAYLKEACAGDDLLYREVESLLAEAQSADQFLETPAVQVAAQMLAENQPPSYLPGQHLGSYTIRSLLGAGGMGVVYRARDTKLSREVAIKVLPEAFARDADRMARFQREAMVLASLNHPNIATIHGFEDFGGTRALVMELVEGPTLADRIRQGPIPVDEAIRIVRQIAGALEYAHEHGIVHRDLKPANIKITADDTAKVLDFGLAKALEGDTASLDISTSPTISRMATQQGVLLGTAAYMSPEQAKGKSLDRRADIWAFGCVLYEMVTGKRAFQEESVTDTLAAVIRAEPDWSQLPAATPIRVRLLLQRCLQKDPRQRLQAIGEARISLDEVLSGAPEVAGGAGVSPARGARIARLALPWGVALALAAILAFVSFRQKPAALAQLLRYEIYPPEKASFGTDFALSPDGRHLVFQATTPDGHTQLWIRDLDSLVSRPLPGTEGANAPFWSPDGRLLAFQAGSKLESVDISGGAPHVICNWRDGLGGSWNSDGVILLGGVEGVTRVSASGGTPSLVTKRDASREIWHAYPSFLPDGRHFLYYRSSVPTGGTYVGSLDAGPEQPPSKPLAAGPAVYAPASGSGPGHVLFLQGGGTLVAQAFDASLGVLEGDPIPVAEGVNGATPETLGVRWSVSANGILAYTGGNTALLQLTWFDRQGKVLGTVGEPGIFPDMWPAISPDGSTLAISRTDLQLGGDDIWLYNFASGSWSRLTFDGKYNLAPIWSPDGSQIAFSSGRGGVTTAYHKTVNGLGEEQAFEKVQAGPRFAWDWSRDGRYLIEGSFAGPNIVLWVLPLLTEQPGAERKAVRFSDEPFGEANSKLSPNGQWIAYEADETGRWEIYVQTFPKRAGKWPVSVNGGSRPRWSPDGKELYFIGLDGKLMAVEVKSGPGGTFQGGAPKALFDPHIGGGVGGGFDVSKDGRFLIPVVAGQTGSRMTIVVNWPSLLKK